MMLYMPIHIYYIIRVTVMYINIIITNAFIVTHLVTVAVFMVYNGTHLIQMPDINTPLYH